MKLLLELLNLYEEINNAHVFSDRDMVMIMNALYKVDHVEAQVNCLVKAVVEAIKIKTGISLSTRDFDTKAKGGALKGTEAYSKIHPNTLKDVAAKGVRSGSVEKKLHLKLGYLHTTEEIKSAVREGTPVILSIVWTDLIFYPIVWITRPAQKERIQTYKDLGANDEMIDAVMKHHIVPYPNDELIKGAKENDDPHASVKHALLAVGYDNSQKVFICRDYSRHNGDEMGFFKLDERIIFDEKLKAEGLATVEAALIVDVESVHDHPEA